MSHRTMIFVWDVTHACRMPWCWNWQHSTAELIYIRVLEQWQEGHLVEQRTNFAICADLKINTNYIGDSGLSNSSRISSGGGDEHCENLNPQKLLCFNFFQVKFWMFSKKIEKVRWTSLKYFLKTIQLQLIFFLNLIFFSTFTGCHIFGQKKFAKNRPKLDLLLLWICLVLRSKPTFIWKYKSQKVELKHAVRDVVCDF